MKFGRISFSQLRPCSHSKGLKVKTEPCLVHFQFRIVSNEKICSDFVQMFELFQRCDMFGRLPIQLYGDFIFTNAPQLRIEPVMHAAVVKTKKFLIKKRLNFFSLIKGSWICCRSSY